MTVRILSALIGVATAANVAFGLMTEADFVVADYLIGAFLVAAALIPERRHARAGLIAANAYALGVFTVAMARRLNADLGVSPALLVVIILAGGCLVFLLLQKSEAP